MSVSKLLPISGANDFNLNIATTYTTVTFTKEYSSGSYSITSGNNDTTLDIYAYNTDSSLAGYTNTKSFTATKGFNKIVVLGGQAGDVLSFSYKTTYTTTDETAEVTAGPIATSVSPSAVPNINDTFTLTGRNFATDATVTFTSANTSYSATLAKTVTRSSVTSLIVTRPDNLPPAYSPYTITVQNPGVSNPTGTNVHILSNSITSGSAPVWVTGTTLPTFTRNVSYSTTVVATDADSGSSITYSLASGSFPTGITLNSSSGVISGTPTSSTNATITIRATDTGGNFVDRIFTMSDAIPVWVTTSLTGGQVGLAYSFQLNATDDSATAPTYTLVSGTFQTGLSVSSSGLISGTPTTAGSSALTFRATDANGGYADTTLTLSVVRYVDVLLIAGGGSGGNGASNSSNCSAGGGAGGVLNNSTVNVSSGSNYSIIVGAGGTGYTVSASQDGYRGNDSSGFGLTAIGGGLGGGAQGGAGGDGGSGGGGGQGQPGGAGTSGQGNNGGGYGNTVSGGAGGGGAASAGNAYNLQGNSNGGNATSAFSTWASATSTGSGGAYAGGGGGGVGSGGQTPGNGGGGGATAGGGNASSSNSAVANTGSGSGAAGTSSPPRTTGAGGSGIVIVRYTGNQVSSGGTVSTTGGYTYHVFTSSGTFTA